MKKLAICREVLHTTTSVQKLISEKNNAANIVINVMTKWCCELFEKTKKNVHHFLNKHKGLHTTSASAAAYTRVPPKQPVLPPPSLLPATRPGMAPQMLPSLSQL